MYLVHQHKYGMKFTFLQLWMPDKLPVDVFPTSLFNVWTICQTDKEGIDFSTLLMFSCSAYMRVFGHTVDIENDLSPQQDK